MAAGMWDVVADHAADVWGVVLVTVGLLAMLALYADALGPVGHGTRRVLGDLLGWGRFLVPVVVVAVGVRLVAGRSHDEDPVPRRDPSRAVLGGGLTQLSIAGLAALAGGSPRLGASTASLSSAGGWIGAVVGNPLRAGLGGFGAATVLLAIMVVALVLFTGVSVRTAAHGVSVAARWAYDVARGGPEGRSKATTAEVEDEIRTWGWCRRWRCRSPPTPRSTW
jgi:S-DNA-T family DNA segregation ATPase FtsK/SpoIIIE